MATTERPRGHHPATEHEQEMARAAQRCIMESLDRSKAAEIVLTSDDGELPAVSLPPNSLRLIAQLLGAMSEGQTVTVVPAEREFSTLEAAHVLNVSRPFLIKQMEAGLLPYRMVGSHRRVTAENLMAYKQTMQGRQADALQRMADDAAELGLDY